MWKIDGLYRVFHNLAHNIEGHWLLGGWLSPSLHAVSDLLKDARDKLRDADEYLSEIYVWVNGIVAGSTFGQLLDHLSGHYALIRFDSRGWVLGRLHTIHWELAFFAVNPLTYFTWKLGALIYKFDLLRSDPWAWFKDIVWHRFSLLYPFLISPVDAIRNILYWNFPPLWALWNDPWKFVRDRVREVIPDGWNLVHNPQQWFANRIVEWAPDLYWFLQDPDWYIKEKIRVALGLPPGFWHDPIRHIFDMLLNLLEQRMTWFADRIAGVAISVIIHFM
jgi:hypothetical protein